MTGLSALATRLLAGACLCLAATGCGSATKLYVQSSEATNSGKVMHMMVRAVDPKTAAASEAYQEVAVMLFAPERDPSILFAEPVFPGKLTTVTLERPTGKSMVLYFFFTRPGENWRVHLGDPLPSDVYIDLGQNQIERIQVQR